MKLSERPVSRTALSWLLILQLAVLLPLSIQLPLWLLLIAGLCWGWRLAIFRGIASPLGPWARAGLVVLCVALVAWLEGRMTSLKGFALLLALGFLFKLVELKNLRDAYAVLLVAMLLLAVNLLFSQSLIMSGLTAISLFVLLCAWVGLNQTGSELKWRQSLKWASALYLLALPITLALFLLVPRLPPLWQISTDSGQIQTGVSDSLSPGDISRLARSDQLAFRASFKEGRPSQELLYWRSVVMTRFDGRRWWQDNHYWFGRHSFAIKRWAKPLRDRESQWISWPEKPKPWGEGYQQPDYQIIMEPSQQHWLPALRLPRSVSKDVGLVADQRLIYRYPVQQRMQYAVSSASDEKLPLQAELLQLHLRQHLAYPESENPRLQSYAKQLWQKSPSATAFTQAFLKQIRQSFVYTLEPPLLGRHAVDEFWFETRRGFCSHYASALALALRVVGIPSRVIGGYQGGEWDEEAQFLQVRQYDAHAWVEYWDSVQGWVEIDPTAAVAPHRIEQSFADSLRARQTQGADAIVSWRLSNSGWLRQVSLQWDRLEYLWHKRVLNYRAEQQYELLKRWFGQVNWRYLMVGLVASIAAFLALLYLWQSKPWAREQRTPEVRLYEEFVRRLGKWKLELTPHQPPSEVLPKLSRLPPAKQAIAKAFIEKFNAYSYTASNSKADWRELKQLVKRL